MSTATGNRGKKRLHFTLGPVQSFVARARRTRDLYAGSYLLSYLTGRAMYAVLQAGGRIIFPVVTVDDNVEPRDGTTAAGKMNTPVPPERIINPLLQAIALKDRGETNRLTPEQQDKLVVGSLPNRFQAEIPADCDPGLCAAAVREAWQEIADGVWDKFIAPVAEKWGYNSRAIWQRQVENFWEIAYVVGDDDSLLDRRKNWRTYIPPVEEGSKCTLMTNLQEISGWVRSKVRKGEKSRQERFWREMRAYLERRGMELELREDERLSAIALIKRLYPHLAREIMGWELPLGYPSTSYLSAVHWLEKTVQEEKEKEKALTFAREIRTFLPSAARGGNVAGMFRCLQELGAGSNRDSDREVNVFLNLDGRVYFRSSLRNKRLWPQEISEKLLQHLARLFDDFRSQPRPYYALLLMDGDHMGVLLRRYDSSLISRALTRFSEQVRPLLTGCNGITIYAGGDDVLALLPLEDALKAAVQLYRAYGKSFAEVDKTAAREASISAAIVYAHHHAPLREIVGHAHYLLDEVAKEKTGRNSIAIGVWKSVGPVLQWSAPWPVIMVGESKEAGGLPGTDKDPIDNRPHNLSLDLSLELSLNLSPDESNNLIDRLVNLFKGETGRAELNNTFFYNLKERFAILTDMQELVLGDEAIVDLFAAEYLKNRRRRVTVEEARERMRDLLRLCRRRRWQRTKAGEMKISGEKGLLLDGLLLVSFLSGGERGEEDE